MEKHNIYGLIRDEIFKLIQAGEITFEQFDEWLDDSRQEAYDSGARSGYDDGYDVGHQNGYDAGYESAQENYGDGPSQ